MTETNSSEADNLLYAHRSNVDAESEGRIVKQKHVDEEIRTYITPLTKQL